MKDKMQSNRPRRQTTCLRTKVRAPGFTLIELLVVIAIIGVLASLVVGLSSFAGRKMRESRIRSEMNQLITAIEAYHAKFGHYPPDAVFPGTPFVNPVTNQLYYELTGTVLDNGKAEFRTPNREETIGAAVVESFFGVKGFVNSSTDPKQVKSFMSFRDKQYQEVSSQPDVELLVVPVPWPSGRSDQPCHNKKGLNPWRYVSKNPTNNPTSFDLWAEYVDGAKVKIICNWSKEVLEKP